MYSYVQQVSGSILGVGFRRILRVENELDSDIDLIEEIDCRLWLDFLR